jgi:xylulokinase
VRHNVEAMRAAGARIDRIVAVGGGTQGSLWTQIVSDATGLTQELPRVTIGASYGAAHLVARALATEAGGEVPDIAAWNPVEQRMHPDPSRTAAYDALYDLYLELYRGTAPVVHALAHPDPIPSEGDPA